MYVNICPPTHQPGRYRVHESTGKEFGSWGAVWTASGDGCLKECAGKWKLNEIDGNGTFPHTDFAFVIYTFTFKILKFTREYTYVVSWTAYSRKSRTWKNAKQEKKKAIRKCKNKCDQKIKVQKTCKQTCKKKNKQTCNWKKSRQKCKKYEKHANYGIVHFLHFWEGLRLELQKFEKMQKLEENAKNAKKHRNKCNFWNCACFAKKQISRSCIFFLHFWLHVFLHFPGPRFLGVALSGCLFFCMFSFILIKFYNV